MAGCLKRCVADGQLVGVDAKTSQRLARRAPLPPTLPKRALSMIERRLTIAGAMFGYLGLVAICRWRHIGIWQEVAIRARSWPAPTLAAAASGVSTSGACRSLNFQ